MSTVAFSNTEERPPWQKNIAIGSVNPGAISGRCIPDLAANVDPMASPYLLVVDGQKQPTGGTSAAAPLIDGLLTLINAKRPPGKRVGYLTPVLYQAIGTDKITVGAVGCTDVTDGNNNTAQIGGYSAGPGYDAVSGWGTPDGRKLTQAIAQALSQLTNTTDEGKKVPSTIDDDDPIRVLKVRFAKGDISKEEYKEMRRMIE